ncbi:unnamed protein product, partial [marine sediment metagenome]
LFSPQSAAPKIREAGDFIFRNWPSSDKEGKIAASLAYEILNLNRAAVLFINNDYGFGIKTTFIEKFQGLNGRLVFEEGVDEGTTDFRTLIEKIKHANPDLIYLTL